MDATLERLMNARKFIVSRGLREEDSGEALRFVETDPVLRYDATSVLV